ncbi:MAG: ABC transporter permease [Gemmatimonadaceae bacterium]
MLRMLRILLQKEFLQIRRDRLILRMLLIMPIVQLLVLANAATFEVKTSNLWIVDQDRTPDARALVDKFTASGRFSVVGTSSTTPQGDNALLDGSANAILVIPLEFARTIQREHAVPLQIILNAENGSQAGVIQSYASEIIARFANERRPANVTQPTIGSIAMRRPVPTIEIRTQGKYNPTLDYKRFMIPGILVQLVTLVGTLMTALNIVREKEAGTLDQLNVTPIKPAVFIAAKLIPLLIIGLFEFSLGISLAVFLFNVPMVGNPVVLLAGATLFLLAALGVGLWVSTVSDTQQQALFVTFSLLMVYILMSGLFTPIRAMPGWVKTVAQINPLMHFIALVRAVMLKGAGFRDVWVQLAALGAIGVSIFGLALTQYRKQTA